jgi:glycosyltransferase involved in cell wall biosynthesis
MKKKIFYWAPFLSKIATEKAVINSASNFSKYNKKYETFVINSIGEFNEYKDKINIINLNNFNLKKMLPSTGFFLTRFSYIIIFFFTFIKLKKILLKEQPDFLIIHLLTPIPLIINFFFKLKTKIILRVSGLPQLNIFRKFFWKLMLKKIHLVTCPTENTKYFLQENKITSSDKIFVLKDPIISVKNINENVKKFQLNHNETKDKYIVSVGRLTKQKNFHFLIQSFKKINKDFTNLKLKIYGDGEEREKLNQMINSLQLNSKVFLENYTKNIYNEIAKSELFVLSSLWEDPGFVLIEAAYLRKTIVSTNCVSGPKDFFKNLNYPYVLKNINDIDEFAELMKNALLNKESKNFKYKLFKQTKDYTIFAHCKKLSEILK